MAGIGHVGLGGDYDGTSDLPDGPADVSCYPALFAELRWRGWSEADRTALGHGNIVRVLADAQVGRVRGTAPVTLRSSYSSAPICLRTSWIAHSLPSGSDR